MNRVFSYVWVYEMCIVQRLDRNIFIGKKNIDFLLSPQSALH